MATILKLLHDANTYAETAREFADKGKNNAAISYLASSLAALTAALIHQEQK